MSGRNINSRMKQLAAARTARTYRGEPRPSVPRDRSPIEGHTAIQSTSIDVPSPEAAASTSRAEERLEEVPNEPSRTRKKLEKMQVQADQPVGSDQVWTITHCEQIDKLIADILCPNCVQSGLRVHVCEGENKGFSSKLELKCSSCSYSNSEMTSPRLQGSYSKRVQPFAINPLMTLLSHEVGTGFSTLRKMQTVLGIEGMHEKTYRGHDKHLTAVEIASGAETLEKAASAVREAYAEMDPDLADALERGETPVLDISVSFDGTWQKRGYTSSYGVGIAIDILTGLVVDFEVLSKYCHACKLAEKRYSNPDDLRAWKDGHQPDCCINHHGSSKAMEQDAAKAMWGRSVQKHKFRYVEMLTDGDSTAYKAVCNSAPYGDKVVEKLECINHAHKRMGTALRKLSKEGRLGGKGTGKLTERKCDLFQNYYRGAIKDNTESVEKMRAAIWATFFHSISSDEDQFHHRCPPGKDSWCFYNRALANEQPPPSHASHRTNAFLKPDVAEKVIPVFKRMTTDSLLSRMQHGGTQNQNESLNSQIWMRCSKTTFVGSKKVEGSVARAVGAFNEGTVDLARIMSKLWVDLSMVTLTNLAAADAKRMARADAAATRRSRRLRKQRAIQRRQQLREQEEREGELYGAGIAD